MIAKNAHMRLLVMTFSELLHILAAFLRTIIIDDKRASSMLEGKAASAGLLSCIDGTHAMPTYSQMTCYAKERHFWLKASGKECSGDDEPKIGDATHLPQMRRRK